MKEYHVYIYYVSSLNRHYFSSDESDKPPADPSLITAHFKTMARSPDDAVCHVMMEKCMEVPI